MLAHGVLFVENTAKNAGQRMPEDLPDEASTLRGKRTPHGLLHVDSDTSLDERRPTQLTRRGLGVQVLDLAQIDRGVFFYYKKRLCKAFLTNGPPVKCYSYVKF